MTLSTSSGVATYLLCISWRAGSTRNRSEPRRAPPFLGPGTSPRATPVVVAGPSVKTCRRGANCMWKLEFWAGRARGPGTGAISILLVLVSSSLSSFLHGQSRHLGSQVMSTASPPDSSPSHMQVAPAPPSAVPAIWFPNWARGADLRPSGGVGNGAPGDSKGEMAPVSGHSASSREYPVRLEITELPAVHLQGS